MRMPRIDISRPVLCFERGEWREAEVVAVVTSVLNKGTTLVHLKFTSGTYLAVDLEQYPDLVMLPLDLD
jgi:hypothetical protein